MLVCKSYYLNGGILFTCASISKDFCLKLNGDYWVRVYLEHWRD